MRWKQGPILAFIYAVKELQQAAARGDARGGLGANIAFVFEGEEENGSGGFRDCVRQNMQWCVFVGWERAMLDVSVGGFQSLAS